ncbi:CD109 antigen-like isoform X2 [Ruditapes philippinarum]|uniref:CD109 antigen-like isoform X2 n=1 Tax=Ruditapes philippinarum TaxID=129788 RepID=UPI00295AC6E8|nr:CD109 antigen-like isoform X2 [Ruditapes philippinarum]
MLLHIAGVLLLIASIADCQKVKSVKTKTSKYTYMALIPRYVRAGSNSTIQVLFAKPVINEILTAKLIQIQRAPGGVETRTEHSAVTVSVPRMATNTKLYLPIPVNLSWGSYEVHISGTGPIPFKNSTSVLFQRAKTLAIFVQTDKAMYKPGDKVQYRVFTVDSKLSLADPLLNIEIFDPNRNKIDELMGVRNKFGIEGYLQLSKVSMLGQWRIHVQVNETDESESYYFEVKKYVLPQFEVTVELDAFGRATDTFLNGRAKATYTFGDPVDGTCVLTISKRYGSGFYHPKAVRTNLTLINGEATFSVPMDLVKTLIRDKLDYETFLVHANCTETMTGQTLEGEGEIRYHSNPYKLEFFPNMADNFKPGFDPYKVSAKVTLQDGSPPDFKPTDNKNVLFTFTFFTDAKVIEQIPDRVTFDNYSLINPFINGEVILKQTKTYPIAADGSIKFDLPIPANTATFSIKAEYSGVNAVKEVSRFRSPTDSFLRIRMLNSMSALKINDIVTMEIDSTIGGININWMILSKGVIVDCSDVNVGVNPNKATVQFKLTRDMTPSARFIAYYVKPDDEVVADGLNFFIENIFENKVTIHFTQPSPQKPKTLVDLVVKADPDSMVKVLAVDKSVKLLGEGNDITPNRVVDEMNQFGNTVRIWRDWGPILPWSFTADDASDIFDNAQIRVLTDAHLYSFDLWSQRYDLGKVSSVRSSGRMMQSSAFSANDAVGGSAAPAAAQGQVRQYFPETWIWDSKIAVGGTATFSKALPDTITEYVANAFALNERSGLGVAPFPANMTALLPFFIKAQLPYSIVRNEIAVIQANIFNKLDKDYNVMVTLVGQDDFVGITVGSYSKVNEITGNQTKCVLVKKGQATPVYFNIKPTKVMPDMRIVIEAKIAGPPVIFDVVIKDLIVKAEGIPKSKNTPILVSFQSNSATTVTTDLVYPPELVPDSDYVRVTVFGDIFGASFENLDKLLRMPYGCGEQNMLYFAPSIQAALYMNVTNRIDDAKREKIRNILKTGYQRQLLYQRNDGSFSAFGNADEEGSLWLTAFVVKSFAQAHKLDLIFIDNNVVERAVKFILDHQYPDGTLNNIGIVRHKGLQGGTAGGKAMLAYVLVALQEVKESEIMKDDQLILRLNSAIVSLRSALELRVPQMNSDYEMAIGAYALGRVNSIHRDTLLTGLENSPNKSIAGNKKYWKNKLHSLEIEIASYALMTYTKMNQQANGLPILRWLIETRNPYGGFFSTQDTVVALQALAEFAGLIYSSNVDMVIDICNDTCAVPANKRTINLNSANHDVLQYVEFLGGKVQRIQVDVKGVGLATYRGTVAFVRVIIYFVKYISILMLYAYNTAK